MIPIGSTDTTRTKALQNLPETRVQVKHTKLGEFHVVGTRIGRSAEGEDRVTTQYTGTAGKPQE